MLNSSVADEFNRRIVLKTDELSEVKEQFLASLNHELRTPLSGILGMTDLLLETSLTEEQKDYVGAARVCAENLLEILNVTLEFSALSANNIRLEETEFSLQETLTGVLSEFAFKADAKNLKLIHTFDEKLPSAVVADPLRLRQMLSHLLANAVKFTNQGEVEISAWPGRTEGNSIPVTIQIRDTGIGIAPNQLGAIFECFRQLETGLARNYPGLGLGLAVVQKLAVLLGASLTVTSQVGQGSTFTIHLALRLPADLGPRIPVAKTMKGRVLVVEDNPIAQTIASHALRRQSFEVECAGDGAAAVEAASKCIFDLILMDLQMPGVDGFQATERIRNLPGYSEVPIIALTANCSIDYQERCANYGMQGFLAKPVRTRELVQTVERFLEAVPR
jgi:CheY-like chemotaxis protein/nitrogen-specific signal transduction histidine kinase